MVGLVSSSTPPLRTTTALPAVALKAASHTSTPPITNTLPPVATETTAVEAGAPRNIAVELASVSTTREPNAPTAMLPECIEGPCRRSVLENSLKNRVEEGERFWK